ncbi:hypothetical protein KDA14_01655 [Candidatus Saccharibacteria bacterium]|nr:hypothetical protein [Candidatus Saccharibacteria bacterium]
MNRGGQTRLAQGFTIVETLIVLAVTSSLFVMTATIINGRQQKTEFQVGSRAIQQQIQQVINEVQTGFYPISGTFSCTPTLPNNVQLRNGANAQGTNSGCTFVGKTMVFGGTHTTDYAVYSLAGRRTLSDNITDVKTPKEANVTAIAPSTLNPQSPNATATVKLPNNLEYVKGRQSGQPWVTTTFPVAFLSSFANFTGSGENTSGSQDVQLRGYTIMSLWAAQGSDANAINNEAARPTPYGASPLAGADICFKSGGTNQSVLITITDGLRVSYSIRSGMDCV